MSNPGQAALAAKLARFSRHAALGALLLSATAGVDLATNALSGDHRVDYAMLGAGGLCLYSYVMQRRLAGRLRTGTLPQRTTRNGWIRAALSITVSFALSAGFGYVLGGWILAVALPSVSGVLVGGATVVGLRRRRRAKALAAVAGERTGDDPTARAAPSKE